MFDPGFFCLLCETSFLALRFHLKVNFLTKLRLKIYDLAEKKAAAFGFAEQKATVMIFK